MESTATSPVSAQDDTAATPSGQHDGTNANAPDTTDTSDGADTAASADAAHELVERAARRAHAAVDAVAARVDALVGGVGDRAAGLTDTRDEWLGAARDAISERPFAAIGIALLLGAGLASLRSSRDR